MVKLSNKGRSKPSKRKTFKNKYKIQKKVRQYRKKVKKQAKKMKQSGIRHKKNPERDALPNLFPFKQQILQQFKNSLPKQPQAPIQVLSSPQFGLVTMQNKPVYFSKGKQNYTKKYITNLDKILQKAKIVLEVLDSRNPQICIDQNFRNQCKNKKVQIITILTKTDTVPQKKLAEHQQKLIANKSKVLRFTQDGKHKKQLIQQIIKKIQSLKSDMGLSQEQYVSVFVAGKQNTGKHTLLSLLCRYAGKYQDLPSQLFQLILIGGVKLIDAPFKLSDKSNFPLFYAPSEIKNPQQSIDAQEQKLLKHLFFGGLPYYKSSVLSRNQILQHYLIQDYNSLQDLCKKIGKSLKVFGKGGMIDVSKVRNKILTQWFQGKLNKYINPMNN